MNARPAIALALVTFAAAAAAAENDKLSTDRPDILTAPEVVGRGRFQIETGGLVERKDAPDTRTRTASTPTLLRLGVSDSLELRVETAGYVRERETTFSTGATSYATGYADASFGVKWQMQKAGSGAPGIGWILQAEAPIGSSGVGRGGVRPAVIGLFDWEVTPRLEASVNAGFKWDRDDEGRRYLAPSAGAGLMFAITDRVGVGAEVVARQLASKRHGGNDVVADVHAVYLLTRNVQVDALAGRGLTHDSPKYLFGAGISARF